MSAVIFNGDYVKALKDQFKFKSGVEIQTGIVDPSSVAVTAPAGSIYINTSTGRHYEKLDAGSSTNWKLWITSAEGETLNAPIISGVVPGSPINGQMWYANDTLNVKVPGGTLQVGEEIYTDVINKTGSIIANGSFIYTSGVDSGFPKAILAKADAEITSHTLAMTTNQIAIDAMSNVTNYGVVHDLKTDVDSEGNTVTAGDNIYLSSTVAGGWTVIEPYAPYYSVFLGHVLVADATIGEILVNIQTNNARNLAVISKEPTGFDNPANVVINYDETTQEVTLSGSNWKAYWRGKEVIEIPSPVTPVAHDNVLGHTYFLYWDGTGLNNGFNWSTDSFPGFDKVLIAYVYYYTGNIFCNRECHGFMDWRAHQEFHETTGTYRFSGGSLTAGTYVLNPTSGTHTTAQNTYGTEISVIKDEDLPSTLPAWIEGTYTTAYRSGAAGDWIFSTVATVPYFFGAGTNFIQYNQNTGATWQLTDVTEDFYMNTYIFFIPVSADVNSQKYRHVIIPGQTISSTLAGAQALSTLNLALGGLANIFVESMPYVKITWLKNSTGANAYPVGVVGRCAIVDVAYNSGSSKNLILASGITPGDHNNLSGRTTADSHPATAISTVITNFNNILSATDTDVQLALDTIDNTGFVLNTGTQTINGAKTFGTVPTLPVQNANKVFAGPVSGSDAIPAFRSLVTGDIPSSDNLANVWGDCEAALVTPQARATLVSTTARTDTWGYLSGASAPEVDTSTELFGTQSVKCLLAVSGEFLETRLFTVPTGYAGKALNVSFLLNTAGFTSTADYIVQVNRYNSSGVWQETLTCQGANFLGINTWTGFFISGSTATDLYSVIIKSATATDSTIVVDSFYVGMKQMPVGMAGTDPVAYTPTFEGLGTVSSLTARYSVSGTFVKVEFSVTGGTHSATVVTISLPAQYVAEGIPAELGIFSNDTATPYDGHIYAGAATTKVYLIANNASKGAGSPGTTWTNGTTFTGSFVYRCAALSSGVTMLNSDRVKSVVRAIRITSAQSISGNTEVIFNSAPIDVKAEFTIANGRFTPKTAGYYRFNYGLNAIMGGTTSTLIQSWVYKNGTGGIYGLSIETDTINNGKYNMSGSGIIFLTPADYISVWATNGTNTYTIDYGDDSSHLYIEQITDRDALAGLPISTQNIVGRTDGVAPAAGFIGEKIEIAPYSNAAFTPTTAYQNLKLGAGSGNLNDYVTLTPGEWDIFVSFLITSQASTTVGTRFGLSTSATAATFADEVLLKNAVDSAASQNSAANNCASIKFPVSLSANTNYYPKIQVNNATGAASETVIVYFYARRVG